MQPAFSAEVKKGGIQHIDLTFEQAYELMLENNNKKIVENKFSKNYLLFLCFVLI